MKNTIIFSALLLAVAFSSCTKKDNGPSTNASVMFVNACDGTTGVYAKVNNANVNGATNITFTNNSGYQNITAGTETINFFLANLGTPLCNGSATLTAGSHYSVFAGGIITGPSFVVATDDLTAPTSGNAKVRFINLSSDALNESFFIGSQKLDSNVAYGQYTPFYQVTVSGSANVLVQDPSQLPKLAQLTGQAFNAGKIYTIMLTGTYTGSGTSALNLTVITNN